MSLLILDEESLKSLLCFALQGSPVKSFDVDVKETGKLYFKIKDVDLDSWFMDELVDNAEMDLQFKVNGSKLNVTIDLYGVMLTVIQNLPLLDNIVLFFCPSLKKIKGLKIISLEEIEVDVDVFYKGLKINNISVSQLPPPEGGGLW